MKACSHCGCLNTERATRCRGCGLYFPGFTATQEDRDAVDATIWSKYGPGLVHQFTHNPVLIWLSVVVPFIVYGSLQDTGSGWTLFYGGIGFSAATCLAISVALTRRVRRGSLSKLLAFLTAAGASVIAAFVPPMIMALNGEHPLAIYGEYLFTRCIGFVGFVLSGSWVICTRRSER